MQIIVLFSIQTTSCRELEEHNTFSGIPYMVNDVAGWSESLLQFE